MRMARMWNARVLLFRIPIPEWTERHSIHSAPRSRMNGMLRMKIKDGRRRCECFRFKCVPTRPTEEKMWKYFRAKWNFTSYLILPKVRGVFQWCFLQEKGNLANDCRRHEEKWLLSVGNKLREQVELPYFFVSKVRRQQQQEWEKLPYLLRNVYSCQICYAMFTRARTHPDGHFFMQAIRIIPSILFQPFLFQNSG